MSITSPVDLNGLLRLQDRLRRDTTCEVRFDAGTRAVYASEASNYRQVPIGVVIPRSLDDFVAAVIRPPACWWYSALPISIARPMLCHTCCRLRRLRWRA